MKKCGYCGEVKDENEYYLKDKKTGRRSYYCKICDKMKHKAYGTKKCISCGEIKDIRRFKPNSKKEFTYHASCSGCRIKITDSRRIRDKTVEYDKAYRKANAGSIAKKLKQYRKKNIESIKSKKRNYYKKNNTIIKEKTALYYIENKDKIHNRVKNNTAQLTDAYIVNVLVRDSFLSRSMISPELIDFKRDQLILARAIKSQE